MDDSQNTLPKYLYHYTSQEGLLGILQSKKLWMTDILYLNDSSEFTHTLDLVKTELENRQNKLASASPTGMSISPREKWESLDICGRKYRVYDDIIYHFDSTYSKRDSEIYVFSLSQEKYDLSQWRGYCPKGIGFCIEFETEKILSLIKNTEYSLIECVYYKENKEKRIKKLFDDLESIFELSSKDKSIFSNIKNVLENPSDEEIIEFLHYIKIIDVSSYLKDESFKNEKEYRIVRKEKSNEIKYRHGNSMIIPYIEGNILDDNKLPISKIIVGPTPHPELSKMSVESLLKSEKYKGVEVEISNIPYRSW